MAAHLQKDREAKKSRESREWLSEADEEESPESDKDQLDIYTKNDKGKVREAASSSSVNTQNHPLAVKRYMVPAGTRAEWQYEYKFTPGPSSPYSSYGSPGPSSPGSSSSAASPSYYSSSSSDSDAGSPYTSYSP